MKGHMQWRIQSKKADFDEISEKYHIDPVIARIIRNRDIIEDDEIKEFLSCDISREHDPALMKDMEKGCKIMSEKLRAKKKVRIISDYDVDGVMSNYILYQGLRRVYRHMHGADAAAIDYDIPHRIHDGYGLNIRLTDKAYQDGVDTIITCDNGIAAFEAIEHAKELAMTVIVTDHHEVPADIDEEGQKTYRLVPADAVIDHKRPDCEYPFKELCGAGVAYKFIRLLYRMNGIDEDEAHEFIEYLGIATVCDIMKLCGENRTFVKLALERLSRSTNAGLRALIANNNLEHKPITTYHLGFIIGPCINACGRLDDAKLSMDFLLEKNQHEAFSRAVTVTNINNERKSMTKDGADEANRLIEEGGEPDKVIVIYVKGLHESLAGIVAGRIKEKYYRPVLLFTDSEDPDTLKGSGRSIEAYNMFDELSACEGLFVKLGGHKMAAGFTIKRENLEKLRGTLNERCSLTEKDMTQMLMIDVPMPMSYADMELVRQMSVLEPFGSGNKQPVFAEKNIRIERAYVMGKNKNVLKLGMNSGGYHVEGIFFEPDDFIDDIKGWFGAAECDKMLRGMPNDVVLDIAYYPEINSFGGRESLQFHIIDYRHTL